MRALADESFDHIGIADVLAFFQQGHASIDMLRISKNGKRHGSL
jgi:hypothetical protein